MKIDKKIVKYRIEQPEAEKPAAGKIQSERSYLYKTRTFSIWFF